MRTRTGAVVAGLLALLPWSAAAWRGGETVDQCDSLDSIPMRQHVNYDNDIQPIWSNRCANCHVDSGKTPSADLNLDPQVSWFYLYNEPSSQDAELIRVIPNQPLRSLLFTKLNCEISDVGLRMPRLRPPLPLAEQALVHDWILGGALERDPVDPEHPTVTLVDTIFRARFEIRG